MSDGNGNSWTAQKLQESLRKRDMGSLYLFFGDETFLIDEALRSVTDIALENSLRDFNLNSFYAADADVGQIRDCIETLPMMANVRVVVIREAQAFSDKEWEQLLPLIEAPVESTVLVVSAQKIDKRKKAIKKFFDKGVVVEFKRPFENQIPDWIFTLAKRLGLEMSHEVIDVFHQMVGSNLTDIHNELLKLGQFIGSRKTVNLADVLQAVSRTRIDSVFDLTDAIGANDRARALVCLANLLDHGQNEVGVLVLITRHLRILKLIRDGVREGLSGPRLSARAGVSPYFLKQYQDQSRRWSEVKLESAFEALLATDRALKSSPVASHIWLESFIVQTCS